MNRPCAALLLVLALGGAGCAGPRQWALQALADRASGGALADETDLELARDSAPAFLKMAEALLSEIPGHVGLAREVASGYVQYAYAFVGFEADRVQATDARRAQVLRQRAAALYRRAQAHADRALERAHPDWKKQLRSGQLSPSAWIESDRVLAYWWAVSSAADIALSKDDPDVVADLPAVVALVRWLDAGSPGLLMGSVTSLLGALEAARPGGSSAEAERIFERALKAAGDRPAAVLVAMAESLAEPAGDRARFEALLRQAIDRQKLRDDLQSQVMRRRAAWLLETIDDRF